MSRKRTLLFATLALLLTATIVAGLILMVRHEPNFYVHAEVSPGKARMERSGAFVGLVADLVINHWREGKGNWDVAFSDAQINSYFEEDFISRHRLDEVFKKQGITNPRIILEDGRIRLAFRYGTAPWSTIISYDLKVWLAPKDMNVICVEILGRHAGALPMSSQSLLNEISEIIGKQGFEVSWWRHEGNPVALVRIQSDQTRPTAQLRRLEVKPGLISIGGLSLDPVLTKENIRERNLLAPIGN